MILVTGGTGKTGGRLAARLRARGIALRAASRSGTGRDGIRFDWADPSTFGPALEGAQAVYLVAPTDRTDSLDAMRPALEAALAAGLRRFVLLGSSALPEGGPMMGAVQAWLRAHAPEWAALRPSWFMQNFSEAQHLHTICGEGAIFSATGEGRIAFVDADDIAAAAEAALLAPEPLGSDVVLTGPRALSYDDVARVIAAASGRDVRHVRLSPAELARRLEEQGLPHDYARGLAALDAELARGGEDRVTGGVLRLAARPPGSFESFAAKAAASWR